MRVPEMASAVPQRSSGAGAGLSTDSVGRREEGKSLPSLPFRAGTEFRHRKGKSSVVSTRAKGALCNVRLAVPEGQNDLHDLTSAREGGRPHLDAGQRRVALKLLGDSHAQ